MFEWKKFTGGMNQWDSVVNEFDGNYRQCFLWGEYKRDLGWDIYRYIYTDQDTIKFSVQLLVRRSFFLTAVYIPGGVSGNDGGYCYYIKKLINSLFRFSLIYVRLDSNYLASDKVKNLFMDNGWFRPNFRMNPGISMQHTFENKGAEIMPDASNKWKYNLRRSKKNHTKVMFDGDIDPSEIIRLSNEMQQNKSAYLRDEPKNAIKILHYFKNQVVFAKCIDKDGSMIGFRCALTINDKAWDFYGATDINGRKLKSGYLLLFELMNECKNRGIKTFNLGGVEFSKSPGVAKFKFDTGGEMFEFISDWEYTNFIFLRHLINFYMYLKVDTFVGNYSRSKAFGRLKKNRSD